MADFQNLIINLLKKNSKGLSFNSIRKRLGVKGAGVKILQRDLKSLIDQGLVYRDGNRYISVSSGTEKGYFQRFAGGFGFLLREGREDVFIPPHATMGAMDGDYVLVAIVKEKEGKKPEGRIIKILKRAEKSYSGTIKKKGKRYIVVPDDKALSSELAVAKARKEGVKLKEGMKVVFRVKEKWAYIEEVIGFEDDPSVDYKLVVAKYKLKEDFPKRVFKEIESVVIADKREDLRDEYIITIDPRDAKDFDDAISVKKEGNLYLLGVHIADVSAYVLEDSKLDKEAMSRGCSTYLIDKVIPMLPHELSSDLCSLRPGEDRYTMSVFMWIDKEGNVVKRRFAKSVINSKARLSYEDAQRIIDNQELEKDSVSIFVGNSFEYIREFLLLARELAWILRERRERRGSLDFDLPEPVVELTPQGRVVSISPSLRLEAHRIIEEFMVRANETVAEFLEEQGMPAIFRVHEYPEESKIQNFVRVAEGILGIKFSFNKIDKFALQKIVKTAEEMGHGPIISYLLLRSMKKAKYSIQNIGHYGLSSDSYVHFTSPIRRYPDLVVHRLLKRAISKKKWIPSEEYIQKLDEIAKLSSQREEISEKAEWELIDLKKYEFMKEKVGEVMQGVVIHLVPQGIFVEIEEFLTEGFIPFSKLKESISFNEENFEVTLGQKKIRLGDRIRVKILSVNKWAKSMELQLHEE
uniref:Ribonuclease R n=1 Tax=candidate division WOR-3 bacterium TaxID=2052148 RepID=A0A7C2P0B8_UNCW3